MIDGTARLADKGKLAVDVSGDEAIYKADHIILATGARPRSLPGIEPDGNLIWTYFEAMVPEELPNSLFGDRLGRDRCGICQPL